jgi:hypothetical protein
MGYQKDSNKRDYVSPQGFKRCYQCGQWHDAEYPKCAPCLGRSDRHTPIGQDQDGFKYSQDEIPPR